LKNQIPSLTSKQLVFDLIGKWPDMMLAEEILKRMQEWKKFKEADEWMCGWFNSQPLPLSHGRYTEYMQRFDRVCDKLQNKFDKILELIEHGKAEANH